MASRPSDNYRISVNIIARRIDDISARRCNHACRAVRQRSTTTTNIRQPSYVNLIYSTAAYQMPYPSALYAGCRRISEGVGQFKRKF